MWAARMFRKFCRKYVTLVEGYEEKKIVLVAALFILCAYLVLLSFLAKYAFANPDPQRCFYVDGLKTTAFTAWSAKELAAEVGLPVKPGYPIDVAHLFRAWFVWGFWGTLIGLVLSACFILTNL